MTDEAARTLVEWLGTAGVLTPLSALWLALLFAAAAFVPFPRTFLCIGAGALMGLPAFFLVLPSSTFGGMLAFLAARHLLSERVQRMAARRPWSRAIASAVDEENWRLVALLSFASPVPNSLQNYLFGITRIGVWKYALTMSIFIIPQTLLYLYVGAAGRSFLLENEQPVWQGFMLAAALSLALVIILVARKVRATLRNAPAQEALPSERFT